jgi:hypothetical protein
LCEGCNRRPLKGAIFVGSAANDLFYLELSLNALWTGAGIQTVPKRTHLAKSSIPRSKMELQPIAHMAILLWSIFFSQD